MKTHRLSYLSRLIIAFPESLSFEYNHGPSCRNVEVLSSFCSETCKENVGFTK